MFFLKFRPAQSVVLHSAGQSVVMQSPASAAAVAGPAPEPATEDKVFIFKRSTLKTKLHMYILQSFWLRLYSTLEIRVNIN